MTTQKQEFSAEDAAPVVLYAKTDVDSKFAFPITAQMFNSGFNIPAYDNILVTNSTDGISHVYYVSNSTTVATLLVTYSSGNISHVYKV